MTRKSGALYGNFMKYANVNIYYKIHSITVRMGQFAYFCSASLLKSHYLWQKQTIFNITIIIRQMTS